MRVQKKPWTSPAIFCRAEREPGHVNTTVMILLIVMSHFKRGKKRQVLGLHEKLFGLNTRLVRRCWHSVATFHNLSD